MIRVVARADVICARACAPTRNDTEVRRVVDHRALSVRAVTLYNTAIRWCQCSFGSLLHFSFPCLVGTKKVSKRLFVQRDACHFCCKYILNFTITAKNFCVFFSIQLLLQCFRLKGPNSHFHCPRQTHKICICNKHTFT